MGVIQGGGDIGEGDEVGQQVHLVFSASPGASPMGLRTMKLCKIWSGNSWTVNFEAGKIPSPSPQETRQNLAK